MLYIELSINDRKVGSIGVHNEQETRVQTDEDDVSWIEVRYGIYDLRGFRGDDEGSLDDYRKIDTIWHDRSDGAAALTARVMDEVDEDRLDTRG